ncbi:PLD nuclease N-terminal domain-containing protein [Virgibacillus doumboii]|uniref:PLD nuclease N-terminal domain-containing protein n=1 Tax=Virgibacillus doumboii TaxID=2697503 RepID=UPI001FE79FCA|nr:PLD nuclease N-terminal domain-containing protein [Virgibacillus doumboii]
MEEMGALQLFSEINWAIIAPFLVIQAILLVVALIDVIRIDRTNGPRWMWVLIILLISLFGPIAYFIFGRRQD